MAYIPGTENDDTLYGTNDDDQILGFSGNDLLVGLYGNDALEGGNGDDRLEGGVGGDRLDGGAGIDTAIYSRSLVGVSVSLWAGRADDGEGPDDGLLNIENVDGSGLDDFLSGDQKANVLRGFGGNDWLVGDLGSDTLAGGAGNDILEGGVGSDRLDGGAGIDTISYANASSGLAASLSAGRGWGGEAHIDTFVGVENIDGSAWNDSLFGNGGTNVLRGAGGNDRLIGDFGSDTLDGGSGQDTLDGDSGNDLLDGGAEGDKLRGGAGNDTYVIDSANDRVDETYVDLNGIPSDGVDTVRSSYSVSLSNATIFSGDIENLTLAGSGNLNGGGNDLVNVLTGNTGVNRLDGREGDDTLAGGFGNDTLVGGDGDDTFLFNASPNAITNIDTITDFSVSDDTIELDRAIFTALTALGTLAAEAFHIGTVAHDADDRVIYDSTTGTLTYDSNGSAGGGATQFATLDTGLALTNVDFFVV